MWASHARSSRRPARLLFAVLASVLLVVGGELAMTPARAAASGRQTARSAAPLWQPFADVPPATAAAPVTSSSGWRVERPTPVTVPAGTLLAVSCAARTSCVAVGYAADRGGSQVALVERLRSGRWTTEPVPVPAAATDTQLTGVSCPSIGFCAAVGYYYDSAGDIRTLAERWDGAAWSQVAAADPAGSRAAGLFAVSCTSATACTAAGDANDATGTSRTLVERWDGRAWTIDASPSPPDALAAGLFAVSCPAAGACTAVGSYVDVGGAIRPLVEKRGAGGWGLEAAAAPAGAVGSGLAGVACAGASDCLAVGRVDLADGSARTLAETWNGLAWSVTESVDPSGSTSSWLTGVSCAGAGRCTAVGQADDSQRGHGLAETWDGSAWSELSVPDPARSVGSGLAAVSCAAAGRCAAVGGSFRWSSPIGLTLAYTSNAGDWKHVATPNPAGAQTSALLGVACPSVRTCVGVGLREDRAGTSMTFADASTDGRWHRQPAPTPSGAITSQLGAVACAATTDCIAVGNYSLQPETQAGMVERWDGRRWQIQASVPLPATTFTDLASVACAGAGDCTAVGYYSGRSGRMLPLAEHWDGRSWARQLIPLPPRTTGARLFGVACPAPTVCVAVGDVGTSAGGRPLAERWNGTAWHVQHPDTVARAFTAGFTAVACSSADTCTAVGSEVNARDRMVPMAERWHPGSWQVQPVPMPAAAGRAELSGLSCGSPASCVAVGYQVQSGPTLALAETWDGQRWTVTPAPLPPGTTISLLEAVACPSADACTAVGYRFGRLQIQSALAIARG